MLIHFSPTTPRSPIINLQIPVIHPSFIFAILLIHTQKERENTLSLLLKFTNIVFIFNVLSSTQTYFFFLLSLSWSHSFICSVCILSLALSHARFPFEELSLRLSLFPNMKNLKYTYKMKYIKNFSVRYISGTNKNRNEKEED